MLNTFVRVTPNLGPAEKCVGSPEIPATLTLSIKPEYIVRELPVRSERPFIYARSPQLVVFIPAANASSSLS